MITNFLYSLPYSFSYLCLDKKLISSQPSFPLSCSQSHNPILLISSFLAVKMIMITQDWQEVPVAWAKWGRGWTSSTSFIFLAQDHLGKHMVMGIWIPCLAAIQLPMWKVFEPQAAVGGRVVGHCSTTVISIPPTGIFSHQLCISLFGEITGLSL